MSMTNGQQHATRLRCQRWLVTSPFGTAWPSTVTETVCGAVLVASVREEMVWVAGQLATVRIAQRKPLRFLS